MLIRYCACMHAQDKAVIKLKSHKTKYAFIGGLS